MIIPRLFGRGQNGPFIELADAVSTTGAAVAVEKSDEKGPYLECHSFMAKFEDWEKTASAGVAKLRETDRFCTVWHKDETEPMVADERLLIGRLSDGRWIVVVWPCP